LTRKLRKLPRKYKIQDIIIFGSAVKGKTEPRDIDIALLVKEKDEKLSEKIEDEIRKIIKYKIDFTVLSIEDVYSSVWLSLIKEGFSIAKGKFLHEIYKVEPCVLFKYNLKSLDKVKKVQFDRGLNEILKIAKGTRLLRTIVIIPLKNSFQFEDFLKTWKIEYEARRFELLPEVQKQKRVIE